jgi:alkylhydroperoxidase family enzyme
MQESVLQARMNNPVMVVPGALQPLLELANSTGEVGLSPRTADLVHLRAAQINGCSYCVDMHSRDLSLRFNHEGFCEELYLHRKTPRSRPLQRLRQPF